MSPQRLPPSGSARQTTPADMLIVASGNGRLDPTDTSRVNLAGGSGVSTRGSSVGHNLFSINLTIPAGNSRAEATKMALKTVIKTSHATLGANSDVFGTQSNGTLYREETGDFVSIMTGPIKKTAISGNVKEELDKQTGGVSKVAAGDNIEYAVGGVTAAIASLKVLAGTGVYTQWNKTRGTVRIVFAKDRS